MRESERGFADRLAAASQAAPAGLRVPRSLGGCPTFSGGAPGRWDSVRYAQNVTGLLEKALRRVEALSEGEQDAIASQILETLNDEESWGRYVHKNRDAFRSLAQEALEEHGRHETLPLEDLLGE